MTNIVGGNTGNLSQPGSSQDGSPSNSVSKNATLDAVGSIITAIDGIENKEFKNAFCPVRPPGHHAEKNKAMGFCIFNNVAVGANYLIRKYKYKKIAIVDWDVHASNGTADIFYDNEKVLLIWLGTATPTLSANPRTSGFPSKTCPAIVAICSGSISPS